LRGDAGPEHTEARRTTDPEGLRFNKPA